MRVINRAGSVFIIVLLLITVGLQRDSYAQEPAVSSSAKPQRFITVDFDNVDIRLFIKYISELTGKNFVVDKQVQGTVTIVSPTKISEIEAYKVFESVLEVHGFSTVSAGAVIKILPSVRARTQNLDILQKAESGDPGDKIITQLVPLRYASPEAIKNVLAPLVNQTSIIIAYVPSSMLIITETQSNIKKLLKIIEVLDVESTENEVAVITLENASSTSLAKILSTVFRQNSAQGTPGQEVNIVPYERVNSLLVLAEPTKIRKVREIIKLLDTKMERGEGNIHVFYLQHANSDELANVLNSLAGKQATTAEQGKSPTISKDVQIMADKETNSLVITATKDEYAVLERVIQKLDIPRRMVYLEALIMEVNTDKQFDVGVEWSYGDNYADGSGAIVGGFNNTSRITKSATTGELQYNQPKGFSFGVIKDGIEIGGITFPSISAILTAYQDDSDINIISTPQILTTDNKKAEISVGENVPYITSSNAGEATGTEYQQYEYKDVSTKLSITPHINQSNTLRLEILTEIIKLKSNDNFKPTTFKRTAETTVLLNDKGTVVIGGIIAQEATERTFKVPILGDIPGVGWLFKTKYTDNKKTNMFIFITPRIIDNPADIATVTLDKEDKMKNVLPTVQAEIHEKSNKENATKLADMGYNKLQQNQVDEAGNFLKQALAVDAQNPYALVNMGVYYERKGNKTQAIEMYKQAILYSDGEMATQTSEENTLAEPIIEIAKENISRLLSEEFLGDKKE